VCTIASAVNVTKIGIKEIDADKASTMFSIVLSDPNELTGAAQLIVKFGTKDITVYQIATPSGAGHPAKPPSGTSAGPAANKQNSDIYLSGTYSPAINSPPQYQIDGSAALMWDLDKQHYDRGQLGFLAAVTTDKRRQVDPDSYRVFAAYQNTPLLRWIGPVQGILFTWLIGGVETDRKANNINFITSPSLDFPIRLFPSVIRAGTQPMAVLTPTVGFETGENFHNAVTPNESRGVFRGVLGGTLVARFDPKLPGFKGIELSSAYTLRLPVVDEIFTNTKTVNGQAVDVPFLGTNPRHYIKEELDLKVTNNFSLAIKHEYGAIPSAFRMVDHKVSVGLTYSLRQTKDGVPTAVRSK